MSLIDDPARFTRPRGLGPGWVRYNMRNYYAGQAWQCGQAGDAEGAARFRALADAAPTMSLSLGPAVPIASRQPDPPVSPEEP